MATDDQRWTRTKPTLTPAGGWQPIPGSRIRPDAEVPGHWRPFALLIPRLTVVRYYLRKTIQTLSSQPASK